jgi:hypothetical protein
MTSDRRHGAVALILLALGLAMRSFGAWIYEFAHTSDHGIICLMVKHMLEGKEFPVFFYGLPYMGSLEPTLSAVLCFFFGLNGFWINMGTALTAFAFLPLVYAWGRGAAGKVAGLAALAFCVIGPPQYFQFESWADGGYAAIPLLTCGVLVYALRLLSRDLEGKPPAAWEFGLLGIVAGLGWWQSPLLIPAFLVCGLLFLVVMRLRLFSFKLLLSGAAGFVIGSLPLWIWNIRNHWQTFDMVKTHDRPSLLEGLRLFYVNRLASLMEYHRGADLFRYAMFGLLVALALLALVRLVAACRKTRKSEALYLAAAFIYIGVYSLLFAQSRFARVDAVRYVLILIPILAVLIGAATAWLTDRFRVLGWIPVVALIALQAKELPKRPPERERTAAFIPKAMKLGEFLELKNIRHLYTDYQVRGANHGLNYLLGEKFVFSPVTRERVRPYARAMEQAENPAVLNNTMGFSNFLKMTGATCETNEVDGMLVQYNVKSPSDGWSILSEAQIAEEKAGKGTHILGLSWTGQVCGVRLSCEPGGYPVSLAVDIRKDSASEWITVVSETPVTRYFWSGDRFYWGSDSYRLECRFKPVQAVGIRIRMKSSPGKPLALQGRSVFIVDDTETMPGKDDLAQLAQWIRTNGINRVYADRWEANKLAPLTDPDVRLSLPPHLYDRDSLSSVMELDQRTVVIKRQRDCNVFDPITTLDFPRFVPYYMSRVGPWQILTFPENLPPHAVTPCLLWAGCEPVRINNRQWALLALKTLQSPDTRLDASERDELAITALSFVPDHRPLAEAHVAGLKALVGPVEGLAAMEADAKNLWTPDFPVNARFRGNIDLLGIKLGPLVGGKPVVVKYLWTFSPAARRDLQVSVQFKQHDKVLFEEHHPLPVDLAEGLQPGDVIVDRRVIDVPKDVGSGPVQIELSLREAGANGGRVKFTSDTVESGKTVRLPYPLVIQ